MTRRTCALPFTALLLSLGVAGSAGCGAGDPVVPACNAISADELGEFNAPFLHPAQVHTGTNGRDTYQAVVATNFGVVSWASSDNNVATIENVGCVENSGFGVTGLITARTAGTATLTATSGSFQQDIALVVAEYTVEQYDLGEQRYNTPANPSALRRPCAECHAGQGSVPHTPLEMALYDDASIIEVTKLGKYPNQCLDPENLPCSCAPSGVDPDTACAACPEAGCAFVEGQVLNLGDFGPGEHVWELTAEEEIAVTAFMRAIPPDGISQ